MGFFSGIVHDAEHLASEGWNDVKNAAESVNWGSAASDAIGTAAHDFENGGGIEGKQLLFMDSGLLLLTYCNRLP